MIDNISNFDFAVKLYNQGQYSDALYNFELIEQSETNVDLLNYIGCCYLQLKKYDEAEKYFTLLKDKCPNWVRPWFNLGRICLMQEKYEKAKVFLRKALSIDPESADSNFYYGVYCEKTGDLKAATKFYEKSCLLEPSVECYLNLSNCYYEMDNFELALSYAISAYNTDNDDKDAVFNLSLLYIKKGHYKKAYDILNFDCFKMTTDIGILENLLFASVKICDYSTAKTLLDRIIALGKTADGSVIDKK